MRRLRPWRARRCVVFVFFGGTEEVDDSFAFVPLRRAGTEGDPLDHVSANHVC